MIRRLPKNNLCLGKDGFKNSVMSLTFAGIATMSSQAAPTLSGSVEAGYNYNLSIPTDSTGMVNNGHSYDYKSKTFMLNNAHIAINGSDSATGLGYNVETDYGSDAAQNLAVASGGAFSAGLPGYGLDLQEAYLTWAFGPVHAIGLKVGKYATYEGIEVVEGGSNPTITRGLLFGFAEPVTHTGLEGSYVTGPVDMHLGVINGWDQAVDINGVPSFVGKMGYSMGDKLGLTVSGIIGAETKNSTDNSRISLDVTGITKAIPNVDLWFQGNYGSEAKAGVGGKDASWLGFGLQPLIHLNTWFGLGLRYEYFMDSKLSRTGSTFAPVGTVTDLTLQNFSIAPTIWLTKTAMVRGEFRMDMASEKVFIDRDKNPNGSQMEIASDFILGF